MFAHEGRAPQQSRNTSRMFALGRCTISTLFILATLLNRIQNADSDSSANPLEKEPLFGTRNGYDAGGSDPMCWSSKFRLEKAKNETGKTNDIEQLNELTFGRDAGTDTSNLGDLLPTCYGGLKMTLVPVSSAFGQMFIGEDFTFRLSLEADLQQLDGFQNISSVQSVVGVKSTIHVRLQLCDALKQGFCNPIRDTRAADSALTRQDTDLRPTTSQSEEIFEFPEGPNKWSYNESDVLLGIPDGSIVAARWCKWSLRPTESNSSAYRASFNITLRLPEVRDGAYFVIGHAVLNFLVAGEVERIDVAQAVPDKVVEVRFRPVVLRTTNSFKIGLLVVIVCSGCAALLILVETIRHRKHPVLQISQGPFLTALCAMALVQIVGTYTALPIEDVLCNISGPALLLPMTFQGAILVGRIWRVYTALSGASSLGRADASISTSSVSFRMLGDGLICALDAMASLPSRLHRERKKTRATFSGIRRTVTVEQTLSLICLLTLPQLFFQCISLALARRSLITEFNSTGDIGREVCSDRWAPGSGIVLMIMVYLLAVWLAWRSRNLPSAFRETDQVFSAATLITVLALVLLSLMGLLDVPTTSPDVQVAMFAIWSIGSAFSMLAYLVLPKIKRARCGESVVMSKLLDSRFSSSPLLTESVDESRTDHRVGTKSLKKGDPLPEVAEECIIGTQNILRDVQRKMDNGKPLTAEDWNLLRAKVVDLSRELQSIELEEDEVPDEEYS